MGSGLAIFSTLSLVLSITIVGLAIYIHNGGFWQPKSAPRLSPEWWGPGEPPSKEDTTIRPFKINVPDKVLEDLNQRLDNTRWPSPPLEGVQFEYGFNSDTLRKVVAFWRKEYKWRERETFLNKYPQFKTSIQGLDIHFIHVKPTVKNVKTVPLLLLHGWPGSIREFYPLIELLAKGDGELTFEVIAPSLPGYGWSSGAARSGLGTAQMAVVMRTLMKRLGHNRWYVQGGDWGSVVGSAMSILYPENIKGFHSNFCLSRTPVSIFKIILGSFWPSLVVEPEYQDKMYPLGKKSAYLLEESGYMHIQGTKPDTIGVGLNDSPAGLAAYIIEKFSTWTNPKWKYETDGGLTKKYSYTDLLDNVMIYWVTGSITTSVRLYAENFSKIQRRLYMDYLPINVPTACANFKHELMYQSESIKKDLYRNIVQNSEFEDGGHFAAMEMPKVMAGDIMAAIRKIEAIH